MINNENEFGGLDEKRRREDSEVWMGKEETDE